MYLVFDIGGTKTRIGISSDLKSLTNTRVIPTEQDFEQAIQNISQVAEELINGERVDAVATGVAGHLNLEKSLLLNSPNIPSWNHRPLKEELENAFETPVYLENDANLGGLGEAVFGEGKDKKIVAFLTIGTGVGGTRIVNQKIDLNSQGFEPGHQIIVPDGKPCNCGSKGCLESYIAGAYLKEPINWDDVAQYLAIGLNNTIVHWSPDIVIIGGGVGLKIPLDKVKQNLKDILTVFTPPSVIAGKLGEDNGLYGGLALLSSSENTTNLLE